MNAKPSKKFEKFVAHCGPGMRFSAKGSPFFYSIRRGRQGGFLLRDYSIHELKTYKRWYPNDESALRAMRAIAPLTHWKKITS